MLLCICFKQKITFQVSSVDVAAPFVQDAVDVLTDELVVFQHAVHVDGLQGDLGAKLSPSGRDADSQEQGSECEIHFDADFVLWSKYANKTAMFIPEL